MSTYKFMRHVRVVKKQLAILFGLNGLSFVPAYGLILLAGTSFVVAWFTVAVLFSLFS